MRGYFENKTWGRVAMAAVEISSSSRHPGSGEQRPPLGAAFRAKPRAGRPALTPLQQKPVESAAAMEGEESDSEEKSCVAYSLRSGGRRRRRSHLFVGSVKPTQCGGSSVSLFPLSRSAQAAEQAQADPGPGLSVVTCLIW